MKSTTVIFDCPLAPWLAAALMLGVTAAVLVFVLRDVKGLTRVRRHAITVLVVLAAVMIGGLLMGPKLIRTWTDPLKERVMVLVDGSRSMLLGDRYAGDEARWLTERQPVESGEAEPEWKRQDVTRLVLGSLESAWQGEVKDEFELSGWQFGSEVHSLALGASAPPFEVSKDGNTTPLGDALGEAAGGMGGRRPRAIVLISDGAWNTGKDPSATARALGQMGVPVFAVGVGNPEPPRDAAVVGLKAPKSVLLGDEMALVAEIAASGMGTRRLKVELLEAGEVVEEKSVVTHPAGRPVSVNFSFMPVVPGTRNLEVRIPVQENEKDEGNNSASATVEVVERKINVLLAEGEPRWEFRFIRNVLERDPAVSLTVFLARPGVGPISGPGYLGELPTDKKDLSAYDVVILGDVGGTSLPEAFLSGLAEMVKQRSGALVVVAGRRGHFRELIGPPVGEILPVILDGGVGMDAGGAPFRPELTQDGATHLVTRLSGESTENEQAWMELPVMTWSAGVSGLSGGATALLVHPYRLAGPSKLPLVAVQRVGTGKVMWCGVEETWRWRKSIGDKFHYRFWAQALRWLVKRPFAEGDPRARLSVDRTECAVGERIEVEAYCLGPDGFPLENAQVWLKLTEGDETRKLVMEAIPGGWGVWRTTFTARKAGKIEMAPVVSIYGTEGLSSSASVEVTQADLEKTFLAQDRDTLKSVAEASGGQYLKVQEIGEIATALAARAEKRTLTAEYSPCRHWLYYVMLAGVLGTVWLVRKRSGLA